VKMKPLNPNKVRLQSVNCKFWGHFTGICSDPIILGGIA